VKRVFLLFLAGMGGASLAVEAGDGPHQQLDWYPEGDERHPIERREHWEERRAAILRNFEAVAGEMPPRADLPAVTWRVEEVEKAGSFEKRTVRMESGLGDEIIAYLYLPKSGMATGAGIVALHPTHRIGKGVVDGQSERPNRAYGRELAERGHVVIAPDYPSFGGLVEYDFANDVFESGTMRGIWNHMRCVDLLAALPDVEKDRVGVIGHSLGGHNAIFLAVFDPRVKAVVTSCGWTPFHDYYGGEVKGWTSDRYLPAIRDRYDLDPDRIPFDFAELIAAIAPRAFFSSSPLRDSNFDWRGVEKAAPEIRKIYGLYDADRAMRISYPDADHDFPPSVRDEAYRFLESALAP